VLFHEHRHSLREVLLETSKLAQHAYEEGHRVIWDEARISKIESNNRREKYKESAHMALNSVHFILSQKSRLGDTASRYRTSICSHYKMQTDQYTGFVWCSVVTLIPILETRAVGLSPTMVWFT
jgi:hypothetical protein